MSFAKTTAPVLVIVALSVLSIMGVATATQEKDEPDELHIYPEVKELLEQRLEILRHVERGTETLRNHGRATAADVLEVRRDRLGAELELATSHAVRIEILRRQIATLRAGERYYQRIAELQRGQPHDVLRVRLERLAVEIDLARELRKYGRREF